MKLGTVISRVCVCVLFKWTTKAVMINLTIVSQVPSVPRPRPVTTKVAPAPEPNEGKTQLILKSSLSNVEKAKLLFPDFSPNKKLRFSQLFGSSVSGRDLNCDWKYGKKKKKYKRFPKENGLWTKSSLTFLEPTPDMIAEGDLERIMKVDKKETTEEQKTGGVDKLEDGAVDDWRSGPGAAWYDLSNVAKSAASYDYGYKLAKVGDMAHAFDILAGQDALK